MMARQVRERSRQMWNASWASGEGKLMSVRILIISWTNTHETHGRPNVFLDLWLS